MSLIALKRKAATRNVKKNQPGKITNANSCPGCSLNGNYYSGYSSSYNRMNSALKRKHILRDNTSKGGFLCATECVGSCSGVLKVRRDRSQQHKIEKMRLNTTQNCDITGESSNCLGENGTASGCQNPDIVNKGGPSCPTGSELNCLSSRRSKDIESFRQNKKDNPDCRNYIEINRNFGQQIEKKKYCALIEPTKKVKKHCNDLEQTDGKCYSLKREF